MNWARRSAAAVPGSRRSKQRRALLEAESAAGEQAAPDEDSGERDGSQHVR